MDSATTLALAKSEGFECFALTVDYGQRNREEINAALRLASVVGSAAHKVVKMDLRGIGGSALTDDRIVVPKSARRQISADEIEAVYVPARNLLFLSLAAAWAEVVKATDYFHRFDFIRSRRLPGLPP
jgi:7-cyano-7-deazaguanine synthase